jgi:pyruvate/2-oxoacid:ferredoxin oxidoreductase alpha subunit
VPEVNYSGQFAELLKARYGVKVRKLNTYGGVPFTVEQLFAGIEKAYEEVLQHA